MCVRMRAAATQEPVACRRLLFSHLSPTQLWSGMDDDSPFCAVDRIGRATYKTFKDVSEAKTDSGRVSTLLARSRSLSTLFFSKVQYMKQTRRKGRRAHHPSLFYTHTHTHTHIYIVRITYADSASPHSQSGYAGAGRADRVWTKGRGSKVERTQPAQSTARHRGLKNRDIAISQAENLSAFSVI